MLIYVIKSFLGILATWAFFKTLSVLLFPNTFSTLSFGRLLRAMVAACFAKPGACVRGLPELSYILLGDAGILRGRYLLLRMGGGGEVLAGEDEAGGRCTLLMEDHWAEKLRDRGDGGVWYVVVKEPFVKSNNDSKDVPREWIVRVRHRSDWDILSSTSPLLPEPFKTAQTWREMTRSELKESGNTLYAQGGYWSAIEHYKQALSRPVDTVPSDLLYRNSAQAKLRLGLHDAAIRDATAAAAENLKDPKNFLKLAQCHYTVRSYALAESHLNTLLTLDPLNVTGKLLLEKCKQRIAESRGEFDFARIRKILEARPKAFLDIADYIGPLKVVSGEYGKGLYTIRDVKAGELLLVSKALQFIYLSDGDLENEEKLLKMKEDCIAEVAERLNNERKLETAFFELWTGKEGIEPKVVDGGYVLDSDVIRLIYDVNCFTPSYFDKNSFSESPPYGEGIWYLPAFMNHACWANTRRSFLGDTMILRAASDIPSNSQLFTPYISLSIDLPTRQAHLRDRYGFTCACAYCIAQSNEPLEVRKSRESIIETLASTLTSLAPEEQQGALHAAIKKVEATYTLPPTEFPRLELLDVYWSLAMTYHHDQPLVGIGVNMKLLYALGFEFDDDGNMTRLGYVNTHAMPTMYQLCISWGALGNESKSKKWRENAKKICGILREDESRFEEIYTDWAATS